MGFLMCICGWVFQSLGTNFATTKTKFVVIPQKPSLASCNPVSRSAGSQMQSKIYIGISDSFFSEHQLLHEGIIVLCLL